jgi:hypothetical protein
LFGAKGSDKKEAGACSNNNVWSGCGRVLGGTYRAFLDRIPGNGWGWLADRRLQSAVQENIKVQLDLLGDEWLGRLDDDTVSCAPK